MKISSLLGVALLAGLGVGVTAQAQDRGPGWDFGGDIVYQEGTNIDFHGGSSAATDSDWGLVVSVGYRFNSHFELQGSIDWQDVDYTVELATDGGGTVHGTGSYEAFTPRLAANYNFTDAPLTPYVNAGIGWSYIDTNIPTGRPQNVCWWDPWWGYVCGQVQNTRSVDGFTYQVGIGLRWDVAPAVTMRFAYEKHWIDLSEADGTPDLDQIKIGIAYRY